MLATKSYTFATSRFLRSLAIATSIINFTDNRYAEECVVQGMPVRRESDLSLIRRLKLLKGETE